MSDDELIQLVREVDPGVFDDSQPFKEYIIGLHSLKKIVNLAIERKLHVLNNSIQEHI